MTVSLSNVLELVGKLDDSPGEETPRSRFRRYLKSSVTEVGQLRDYIEECLRKTGEQYNRALQDLVNHLGTLLGFEVEFGRYQGVQGEIGFDGLWKSPKDFYIVCEVKTTEVYAIRTSTLVGYVDQLISEKRIPNWNKAMGLYVIGRPDPEIRQLENAIVAEQRMRQLRITSVESLLSLAEFMSEYDVTHEDVLAILKPSGPSIDPVVELISRLIAEEKPSKEEVESEELEPSGQPQFWLTPVRSMGDVSAEECIRKLVGEYGIYAFGERTPGRKHIRVGDWICFYATSTGVVAHAQVASEPEYDPDPRLLNPEKYPYRFTVTNPQLYLENPRVIDLAVRQRLDAFQGKNPNHAWAWFVQATRRLTKHDFELLTGLSKHE